MSQRETSKKVLQIRSNQQPDISGFPRRWAVTQPQIFAKVCKKAQAAKTRQTVHAEEKLKFSWPSGHFPQTYHFYTFLGQAVVKTPSRGACLIGKGNALILKVLAHIADKVAGFMGNLYRFYRLFVAYEIDRDAGFVHVKPGKDVEVSGNKFPRLLSSRCLHFFPPLFFLFVFHQFYSLQRIGWGWA